MNNDSPTQFFDSNISSYGMNDLDVLQVQMPDYGAKNHRPFNRGQKLKRVIEQSDTTSHKPSLISSMSKSEEFEMAQLGKKRAILSRVFKRELKDDLTSARHLIEDDPYLDVHIDEAWGIPEDMDQVGSVGSMVYTLRNRHLKGLSQVILEIIEEECSFYRTLARLGDVLAREDTFSKDVDFSKVPEDVMNDAVTQVQEMCNVSKGYIDQLTDVRGKIMSAYMRKKRLAKSIVPFD